jgi:putative FmdB family regulatory protein
MPTYELQCTACDKRYTIRSSINQPLNPLNCPECTIPLKRVYTAPGITFKGDGWGKDN